MSAKQSHVFPRQCHADLPIAVGGEGCYLIDAEGRRYFDGSGGAAVSCLGHSNERVREAIKLQVDQLAFAHTGFFTSEPAEALEAVPKISPRLTAINVRRGYPSESEAVRAKKT